MKAATYNVIQVPHPVLLNTGSSQDTWNQVVVQIASIDKSACLLQSPGRRELCVQRQL